MRFRIDGEGDSSLPHIPHTRPKPAGIDQNQRVEFLKLLHDGLGWTMACAQLGLSIRELRETLAMSPGFRRAIQQIEEVRAERLFALLYEAALNGDTRAAQFLLARHDREVERRKPRRDRDV